MAYEIIPLFSPKNSDLSFTKDELKGMVGNPIAPPIAIRIGNYNIYFDFNNGFRLLMPKGKWHVKVWDSASQIIFFDEDISEAILISLEKFFIEWEFEIYLDGNFLFRHRYNPAGYNVHFHFPSTGMGDQITMFSCMEEFCRKWNCNATCTVAPYLRGIIETYFPTIKCVDAMPAHTYASYLLSPGFSPFHQPVEIRKIPMLMMGREILGLGKVKKKIYHPTKPRQILEPYVCIAVQTSATFKTWLNPTGWDEVVAYLKSLGYRVLCIDKNAEETDHGITVKMPTDAENFTGDIPLLERINLLAYADFFIGLSSGLSWLAWAVDIPVILISGITAQWCEFHTPYRIINRLVCNGCHNDITIAWPQFEICPRHKGTERAYECSRKISARQVINAIDDLRSRQNNS